MWKALSPQDQVTPGDLDRGLRMLVYDGMCSQALLTLTQGPILVAFALLLGASNTVVGLVLAIGPGSNILQIPSIFLVERTARRKATVVLSCLLGRSLLIPVALLPWLAPGTLRLPLLVLLLAVHCGLGAVAGCGFNSWVHDLVPPASLARFFARRMGWAMGLGAVLSLASGLLVEAWARHDPDPFPVYAAIFLAGTLAGYLGCVYLARIPEPRMSPGTLGPVREVIAAPFRDSRFRRLLSFVGLWTFAANLAAPFFAVYLLEHLGLSVGWVLGLSVFSQVAHALSLRLWGRMAERRSNRVVLACACPAFLLAVALWPISSLPIGPVGLGALLVLIHALAGVSTAGVNLCAGNLALKEAPKGKGTAYLAGNGLVAGVAATLAPLLAGVASDGLQASGASLAFLGLVLSDLDFVFLAGALLGLLAMASLARVEEAGEPQERIRVLDLYAEALRFVGQTTTVGGLRRWAAFPFARLRTLLKRRPRANPDDGRARSSSRR